LLLSSMVQGLRLVGALGKASWSGKVSLLEEEELL